MPSLDIDNLTVVLLSVLAALLIYLRFFSRPEPLVHPLLLGKQSEVSKVRQEGETGVYRSWATGQDTPLSVRPASTLKTVEDVVSGPRVRSTAEPRCILGNSLSDEALGEILRLLPLVLTSLFSLSTDPESPSPILALLPSSPLTAFPLLLFELASNPACPLVVLPTPRMLTQALTTEAHPKVKLVVVHASLAEDVIEQVWEDRQGEVGLLIVGDPQKEQDYLVQEAIKKGMNIHYWEETWETAEPSKKATPEAQPSDIHSYFYSERDGAAVVSTVSHQNVTAGIAGVLSSFPADKRPSSGLNDVVGTAVSLHTPLGMSIAMAALWSGAAIRVIGPPGASWNDSEVDCEENLKYTASTRDQPRPTVLFLTPPYFEAMLRPLHAGFVKLPFVSFIARHRLSHVTSGYVARGGWTERWGLSRLRDRVLGGIAGDKLRATVIVGDPPSPATLTVSHVLLGTPVSRLHPSPFSAGPIFASHFYDLQTPSVPDYTAPLDFTSSERAHTGPPAVNVEVLLKGEKVETEGGEPLQGKLWTRGPALLRQGNDSARADGWIDLGEDASVRTNGTFVVSPRSTV